jgi:iron transport multicopper oxidase
VTGWLVYDQAKPFPDPILLDTLEPFDDMTLQPFDEQPLLPEPNQTFELNVVMDNLGDGANYAFFNNITYHRPTVPTLYSVMSSGELSTNPTVYGSYTHSLVLAKDEVVQIVINNLDPGRHPFHLHGHNFQSLYRAREESGTFADANITEADFPKIPMRRDTLVVFPNGNIVLRFKADNPGMFFFFLFF